MTTAGTRVETRHIRFDVQQRGPVQHIDIFDLKDTASPRYQTNQTDAQRIGAGGRACGEHSVLAVFEERLDGQAGRIGAVEGVDEVDVGETF